MNVTISFKRYGTTSSHGTKQTKPKSQCLAFVGESKPEANRLMSLSRKTVGTIYEINGFFSQINDNF